MIAAHMTQRYGMESCFPPTVVNILLRRLKDGQSDLIVAVLGIEVFKWLVMVLYIDAAGEYGAGLLGQLHDLTPQLYVGLFIAIVLQLPTYKQHMLFREVLQL